MTVTQPQCHPEPVEACAKAVIVRCGSSFDRLRMTFVWTERR
jgi:hypothetical protein